MKPSSRACRFFGWPLKLVSQATNDQRDDRGNNVELQHAMSRVWGMPTVGDWERKFCRAVLLAVLLPETLNFSFERLPAGMKWRSGPPRHYS